MLALAELQLTITVDFSLKINLIAPEGTRTHGWDNLSLVFQKCYRSMSVFLFSLLGLGLGQSGAT